MQIWSAEIKQLSDLYESLKGQLPGVEKELEPLIRTDDSNVILLYSRRCLEVIITDLCECELKRPRKTEPLKGIIDKLNKEEIVPSHIITSMHGLNDLSTYGTHPKDFDPEQVKPVLNNLTTIIKWYLRYKDIQVLGEQQTENEKSESKGLDDITQYTRKAKKRLVVILAGSALIVAIVLAALFLFDIIGGRGLNKEIIKSIAVLPFTNMSGSGELDYLGDQITDEIIMQLYKINEFEVRSRTSIMKYKNSEKGSPEIGKELNVNYLLEGSIQRNENQVRIRAQLIHASTDDHKWAEIFEGEWKDIFDLEIDVAKSVAAELKTKLSTEEIAKIDLKPTENEEAYTLYLKGNYLLSKFMDEDAYWRAIDNFKQAIALDSNFAEAYAGMAAAFYGLTNWSVREPDPELIPVAKDWANKALEINDRLGDAYYIIGGIKCIHEWDWDGADQAFRKGMEYNPNYVEGRIQYANFLTSMRRFEESITIGRLTIKLDPLNPKVYNELAYALWHDGQDKEALELYNKSLELDPDYLPARFLRARLYTAQGIYNKVVSDYCDSIFYSHDNDIQKLSDLELSDLGRFYAQTGQRDKAIRMLNELKSRLANREDEGYEVLGYLYSALGENEKAIDLFEKSYNQRDPFMYWINVDLKGDSIYENERFIKLLKKIGLER